MRLRLFKRLFLCDISFLFCAGLTIVLAQKIESSVTKNTIAAANKDVPQGNCSCGGFPTKTPSAGDLPVISQTPGLIVPVDAGGEETCKTLCFALAQATRAKGPAILCSRLKNAHEITLSVFHKVDPLPWKYSEITAPEPLCCKDNKATVCPSVLATRTPPENATLPDAGAATLSDGGAATLTDAGAATLPAAAAVPLPAAATHSPAADTKNDSNVKFETFDKE